MSKQPVKKKPKKVQVSLGLSAYYDEDDERTESENEDDEEDEDDVSGSTNGSSSTGEDDMDADDAEEESNRSDTSRSQAEENSSDGTVKAATPQSANGHRASSTEKEGIMEASEQEADGEIASEKADTVTSDADNNLNRTIVNPNYTLEAGFPEGCKYIKLPSAPRAQCSQSLQNKIIQVVNMTKQNNFSMNDIIHSKKTFKNPCIYQKLIDQFGLDEFGSSFPSHVSDLKASGYMMFDELDQQQRAEWAKQEKARKDRTKIEMVSATKKK